MEKRGRVEGGNKVEKGAVDGKMWKGLRMGIRGWGGYGGRKVRGGKRVGRTRYRMGVLGEG